MVLLRLNKIMKIYYPYYYFFYRLVKVNDYLFPKYKDSSNFGIVNQIAILQAFNIYSLELICEINFDYELENGHIFFMSLYFVLLSFNLIIFLWKKRDKRIMVLFENESKSQRKKGIVFFWTYFIGTFILLLYVTSFV